ncbi:hypothetical protein Sjap_000926 [Stephania japonica]|uniref:non-specific serine/threonine protein kinase n=1 Tax=Stephania japonica TaxID=461633 RepID=A0AAP0PUJ4_9MAGN
MGISINDVLGLGSTGPIAAAFGENWFFCAIDASGKQQIFCWDRNSSSASSSSAVSSRFSSVPSLASLSGGDGFLCGISSNTSKAYCWSSIDPGMDLVPPSFRNTDYSKIASGANHVCAVRGFYGSSSEMGSVDCWAIGGKLNKSNQPTRFDAFTSGVIVGGIVSGEGFSCGGVGEKGIVCWGPRAGHLRVLASSGVYVGLAASRDAICAISGGLGELKCWGEFSSFDGVPGGIRFVALTAGAQHFCGIREDDHGIECWGRNDLALVPKGSSGFLAIAASDFITCGVREDDLIIDCWGSQGSLPSDYSPPLQLCSPGLCTAGTCGENKFAFNASILSVPDLTSLCVRRDLKICSPCGLNCSKGFFPSSACSENADRVCTACSLCQNSSCWDVCGLMSTSETQQQRQRQIQMLAIVIGSSISGLVLLLLAWCLLPCRTTVRKEIQKKKQCTSCIGKPEVEVDTTADAQPTLSLVPCIGTAQVFRLSDLKDATNGFKEFNELGRGKYGFVYKAILSDGQQVAVKRANAATIIHINNREFESELEVLCKIRHSNIVNLLGYCEEMGERLLVYEYMPHGTLYDHLHGELSPLNWTLRLKISYQAARGLEYLHKDCMPPIDQSGDLVSDIYSFGIVLLEILSGRKCHDKDYTPSSIVDWARPLIRQGKAAAIIDRGVALPRNVEPLLKLAEISELALKEDHNQRPAMSDLVFDDTINDPCGPLVDCIWQTFTILLETRMGSLRMYQKDFYGDRDGFLHVVWGTSIGRDVFLHIVRRTSVDTVSRVIGVGYDRATDPNFTGGIHCTPICYLRVGIHAFPFEQLPALFP